jgi:hypothetical protein
MDFFNELFAWSIQDHNISVDTKSSFFLRNFSTYLLISLVHRHGNTTLHKNNFISFAIYKVLNTWWSQGRGSITLHLVLKEEYVSSSDGLFYDWGLSDLGYMQLSKIIVMKLRHWISRSQLEFRFILLSFVCLSISLVFSPKQFCYLMHYNAIIFIGLPEYVHVVFLFLFL